MASSIPPEEIRKLALPHVAALRAYEPGLQPGETGWIKLNTNENPYPPSPRVVAALRREIGDDGASLRLYPSPGSTALRETIARRHRVGTDCVFVGNGADDVLNLLARCFCTPGSAAGFMRPSYSLYPVLVGLQAGRAETLDFDRSMRLPVEAITASPATVFFLTSPNAPTGVGFRTAEIEAALRGYRGLLVVDETYAAFAAEDACGLVTRYPGLCLVRSLSKTHCLAGMRIGYALAHPETIRLLDTVKDSYNVSRLAQAAGVAALEDPAYYAALAQRIIETRDRVYRSWTEKLGWFTYPSQANFLFTEPRARSGHSGPAVAAGLYDYLRDRRILVRYFGSHALTSSFLRISVGTDAEMSALQEQLEAWLNRA